MEETRYTKIATVGSVHGKRSKGSPRLRWMDQVKKDCEERGVSVVEGTRMTVDRERWRRFVLSFMVFCLTGRS
jgi:hypothetical protein